MTIQTNITTTLNPNKITKTVSLHLRKNPATSFVFAFEASLLLAAVELIEGNLGRANTLGIYTFVALVTGVALHAISVIKGSKEGKTNP